MAQEKGPLDRDGTNNQNIAERLRARMSLPEPRMSVS
jgi:hypothetical protein